MTGRFRILGVLAAVALAVVGLVCVVRSVRAAPAPDVPSLRAELERVREAASASVPEGAFESIAYTIDVAERIERGFATQAAAWRARAQRWLASASDGRDAVVAERGKLVMRGYRSPVSLERQGYAIYIPPGYDPAKRYPLLIALHGGSANGNLFLGVVLGNNMNWKAYPQHLWDEFEPRWAPDWIVVAPDGFGQVMWRWMGERDVIDVIDDVRRHYNVDDDRIVLSGLSNGGVGAYSIGMRHAWRFAAVLAIAGAPSWLQYAGGSPAPIEETLMHPVSGMSLAENAINTDFRYFHGRTDTGPMRPGFVEELGRRIRELGVPFQEKWYDLGHDLLYVVHRHGKIYEELAGLRRKRRPKEVRVVTGDYGAARQHWVTVTRFERYPELARVRAVAEGDAIRVETSNVRALSLDLRDAPLDAGERARITIDGKEVHAGARAALGHVIHLHKGTDGWRTGFPPKVHSGFEKKPGLSGPITDAYTGALLHVYGTADPAQAQALRDAAERGAKGWPLWLWRVEQRVVADSEVTDTLMRSHHVVLYATPGANRLFERMAERLPVRIEKDAVVLDGRRHASSGVGVKLVYPNPLAPERYVIVQAAPTASAVAAGHKLPDFLPDWVVYDAQTTRTRPRLVFGKGGAPPGMGFFDERWQVCASCDGRPPPPLRGTSPWKGEEDGDDTKPLSEGEEDGDDTKPLSEGEEDGDDTKPLDGGVPEGVASGAAPVHGDHAKALDGGVAADAGVLLPPIPRAPPRPPVPDRFEAPPETQAGQAAREIAKRAHLFPNFRAVTHGARWIVDPAARWSIRANDRCLAALAQDGVHATAFAPLLPTPVPTPVELAGRVDGVWFRMAHAERPLLMSCELAARLPALVKVLKAHGVRGVDVMSSYRDTPRTSFHTFGFALDLYRFWTLGGTLGVEAHFEPTPEHPTCTAPRAQTPRARALRDIACRLAESKRFSTVLTPNYNDGHRDHFHVDVRPDDPRVFIR